MRLPRLRKNKDKDAGEELRTMETRLPRMHELREYVIRKLSLEDKHDVLRLTVTSNFFEQITFSTLYWLFHDSINEDSDDPLAFGELVDKVMTMRITEKGRSRKDIKDVYTFREHYTDIRQPVSTPRTEEQVKKRRWV